MPGRRSAYILGNRSLSCLREATEGLLWDDGSFYSLRRYRSALGGAHAKMAQYATALGSDDPLYAKYAALDQAVSDSIALADEAVAAYGALGTMVDARRVELVAAMRARVERSRGDINDIVASIQRAEAVKQVQNQAVDERAEDVARTAAQNSVDPATPSLIESLATGSESPDTQAESAAASSVSILQNSSPGNGLRDSIAAAAYAMQRIATISPRYVKAQNNVASCIYP